MGPSEGLEKYEEGRNGGGGGGRSGEVRRPRRRGKEFRQDTKSRLTRGSKGRPKNSSQVGQESQAWEAGGRHVSPLLPRFACKWTCVWTWRLAL